MSVSDWSTTPSSNNASPPNGAPEGMPPSSVNDVMRQIMADVRAQLEDGEWLNWGHVPTRVDNDTFTVPTDLTALYHVGRRIKATGSATGYATIASVSYSAPNTTVNVTMDSGNLPGTLSAVYVGILSVNNSAVPYEGAAAILTKLLTVDGSGSGLDADLLDGQSSAYYLDAGNLNSGTLPSGRLTGTYSISISGNAATATSATSASSATNATNAVNADTVDGQHAAAFAAASHSHDGGAITTGTVAAARLPLIGNLSGITIQPDPGGTPSGSAGQMFWYY